MAQMAGAKERKLPKETPKKSRKVIPFPGQT